MAKSRTKEKEKRTVAAEEDKPKTKPKARKEEKKVARRVVRKAAPVVVPGPWNPRDHKPEYLEMLKSATNKARFKLSGQLLAVMNGQTEERDGDPIPAPVQNLGTQLSGLVEQVATKQAIAEFDKAKEIYERERQRMIKQKTAQDEVKTEEIAAE